MPNGTSAGQYDVLAQGIPNITRQISGLIQHSLTSQLAQRVGQAPTLQAGLMEAAKGGPFPGAVDVSAPEVQQGLQVAQVNEQERLKQGIIQNFGQVAPKMIAEMRQLFDSPQEQQRLNMFEDRIDIVKDDPEMAIGWLKELDKESVNMIQQRQAEGEGGEVALGAPLTMEDRRERVKSLTALRKEIQGNPSVKDFNEISRSWTNISAIWPPKEEETTKSGKKKRAAIDQALITLYNKMLDPGSVVRESEYARTPENVPAINRFMGRMQQVVAGGAGLTDTDRQEIFDTAFNLFESSRSRHGQVLQPFLLDVRDLGVPLSRVFNPIDLDIIAGKKLKRPKGIMQTKEKRITATQPRTPAADTTSRDLQFIRQFKASRGDQ